LYDGTFQHNNGATTANEDYKEFLSGWKGCLTYDWDMGMCMEQKCDKTTAERKGSIRDRYRVGKELERKEKAQQDYYFKGREERN